MTEIIKKDAVTNLLIRKGIISEDEITTEILKLRKEDWDLRHKDIKVGDANDGQSKEENPGCS